MRTDWWSSGHDVVSDIMFYWTVSIARLHHHWLSTENGFKFIVVGWAEKTLGLGNKS